MPELEARSSEVSRSVQTDYDVQNSNSVTVLFRSAEHFYPQADQVIAMINMGFTNVVLVRICVDTTSSKDEAISRYLKIKEFSSVI